MDHVIIGNGIAGITAAQSIRHFDPTSSITVIGCERFPPYCRPMISMLVEGSIEERDLVLKEEQFFDDLKIEAKIGQRVEEIDTKNRVVHTDAGEKISFDALLIATGADPLRLEVEGHGLDGIFFLRNREDAKNIAVAAKRSTKAVIVGGGLVGLKAAHALTKRGLRVTIIEKLSHLLPMMLDERAGKRVEEEAEKIGIQVITSASVSKFVGGSNLREVVLDSGRKIECEMAIVAAGVRPAVSFLDPDEISINKGVVVDEFLQSNVEGIYAAGDVAEVRDVVSARHRLTPIWPEAATQGRIAGLNMVGHKVRYEGAMPRNVIRFEGIDLFSAGLLDFGSKGNLRSVQWEDFRTNCYRRFLLDGDRLVGAIMVNDIEQAGVVASLIRKRTPIAVPERLLVDPLFNFSKLLPRMG